MDDFAPPQLSPGLDQVTCLSVWLQGLTCQERGEENAAGYAGLGSSIPAWWLPQEAPLHGGSWRGEWLKGQGDSNGCGFSGKREGRGLAEGLVLQSEDLQMLTHSCVRHITICQLL